MQLAVSMIADLIISYANGVTAILTSLYLTHFGLEELCSSQKEQYLTTLDSDVK